MMSTKTKTFNKEEFKKAARSFDVDIVMNMLKNLSKDEIIHLYDEQYANGGMYCSSTLDNIIGSLFCGGNVNIYDFNNNYIKSFDELKDSAKQFYHMTEQICKTYPYLVTDRLIELTNSKNAFILTNLFTKYYINNNNDDICYMCSSSHKSMLIQSTCLCKMKIHVNCLVDLVNKNGDDCKTCKSSFNSKKINDVIHFPKNHIYKAPLMSYYVIIDDKDFKQQLKFAILYLQNIVVRDVLNKMSNELFKEFINDDELKTYLFDIDTEIKIKNNLPSNLFHPLVPFQRMMTELVLNDKLKQISV